VKRFQVGLNIARLRLRAGKMFLRATPQGLGKKFCRKSPPLTFRFRVQRAGEQRVLFKELIQQRERCFFGHEFGRLYSL
jgi:hypothetical protein